MDRKLTFSIIFKTIFLFPFFIIFILSPIVIIIVISSFIPKGKIIASSLYEFFGWVGLKIVGINLIVTGKENVNPNQSYVVVSNHPSTLDIFTHIHGIPLSTRFLTKAELYSIPLFGRALKVLGLPKIDRQNAKANFGKINESIQKVIESNLSILVFAEGKRSNSNKLLPFKKGAAFVAKEFNLPILPVVSHNAHNLMQKGEVWFRSGTISLEILQPIENTQELTVEELTTLCFKLIEERLTFQK